MPSSCTALINSTQIILDKGQVGQNLVSRLSGDPSHYVIYLLLQYQDCLNVQAAERSGTPLPAPYTCHRANNQGRGGYFYWCHGLRHKSRGLGYKPNYQSSWERRTLTCNPTLCMSPSAVQCFGFVL